MPVQHGLSAAQVWQPHCPRTVCADVTLLTPPCTASSYVPVQAACSTSHFLQARSMHTMPACAAAAVTDALECILPMHCMLPAHRPLQPSLTHCMLHGLCRHMQLGGGPRPVTDSWEHMWWDNLHWKRCVRCRLQVFILSLFLLVSITGHRRQSMPSSRACACARLRVFVCLWAGAGRVGHAHTYIMSAGKETVEPFGSFSLYQGLARNTVFVHTAKCGACDCWGMPGGV